MEPAFKDIKDGLMTKNVAEELAGKLYESVATSLEGKRLASFSSISSTVQTAMEVALTRILTPKRSIDILRDVYVPKDQGRAYVVVFDGVNGVGKSTNLAKVVYWLLQHDVNVMIAACNTFRSGAVEQLRTHARRLQIPIFEKGYRKAIQEASRDGFDVVLVDTAGRMQVVLVANSLSALNNVTAVELSEIIAEAAKHCNVLRKAAETGSLVVDAMINTQGALEDQSSSVPVMVVENGCGGPCIDLRQVSSELAAAPKRPI